MHLPEPNTEGGNFFFQLQYCTNVTGSMTQRPSPLHEYPSLAFRETIFTPQFWSFFGIGKVDRHPTPSHPKDQYLPT